MSRQGQSVPPATSTTSSPFFSHFTWLILFQQLPQPAKHGRPKIFTIIRSSSPTFRRLITAISSKSKVIQTANNTNNYKTAIDLFEENLK
jgi:hypothetical protein